MKHFCSFSEAIREGAKLKPQVRTAYYTKEGTCAIGAGLHAMFLEDADAHFEGCLLHFETEAVDVFPYMLQRVRCPAHRWWNPLSICRFEQRPLLKTCSHLNDFHKWSREQIADWLESEEEKLGFVTLTETAERSSSIHSQLGQTVGV